MTERAQALEAALREFSAKLAASSIELPADAARILRENLWELYEGSEAVPPPPPVGSPTTQIDVVCHECGGRGGEYWHEPDGGVNGQKCGVCNGFGHVLASEPPSAFTLGQEFVSRVTSSNAPEGPSVIGPIERDEELVTFALELAVATLGAEGCACQPEEPCALCMCKEAVAHLRDTSPAPVSPVEPTPEPPNCGAVYPRTGVWCELPQGHAENHRGKDARHSVQWPKDDPAPTGAPAPCVWRMTSGPLGNWITPSCIAESIPAPWGTERAVTCYLCGSALRITQ